MSDGKRVFILHYIGTRFHNHRMPVEVLPDLPAFRDLLLAFAKDEWRKLHPDRKKLPKNFDKEFALSLFAIAPGSAMPKLEWQRQSDQMPMFDGFEEIESVVDAAYQQLVTLFDGDDVTVATLGSEQVRALNKFGAGLKENERIDLPRRDGTDNVVSLDMHRRKMLIVGTRETYQSRLEGTGELVGTESPSDPSAQCFIRIQTLEHGTISIPVDRLHLYEEFAEALNTSIQFEILVELDQNDKLRSVVDVFDVATVEDDHASIVTKAKERIEELADLAAGWDDGEGQPIGRAALARTLEFVVATRSSGVEMFIFPTTSSGILLDFALDRWEYSIEFSADGAPEMYGIEVGTKEEMLPISFDSLDALISEFNKRRTNLDEQLQNG